MKKIKSKFMNVETPEELAKALRLPKSVAVEWKVRSEVTYEIIRIFKRSEITVTAFAKMAKTSRARITRILKSDTSDISLDVLLRVLGALGQTVQLKFFKAG